MKRVISLILVIIVFSSSFLLSFKKTETKPVAESKLQVDISAGSAVLMEANTGEILYSKNEKEALPPASVTKIMTLLLACEALHVGKFNLEDKVSISAYAASKGGSQVFLEEGEIITVEELFKATIIASANDAAVALAELVSGSESSFVKRMNERAEELMLESTVFENATGLDDTAKNHVTSALDIAIMSRELIKYDFILKYSSLWQDTIRNGEFTLTNTNRLVRFYDGCNGLKTGSTDKAGFCMSATAKRSGMQLIAVIMGAETRDVRNSEAKKLLDTGFASYEVFTYEAKEFPNIKIIGGENDYEVAKSNEIVCLVPKGASKNISITETIYEDLRAPFGKNDAIGTVEIKLNDIVIGKCDILILNDVKRIEYFEIFKRIICAVFD